jgi:hypothetical protein
MTFTVHGQPLVFAKDLTQLKSYIPELKPSHEFVSILLLFNRTE